MLPVLDLDPVVAPSWPVDALTMLGDQALKPHPACSLEQVGADLALLEGRHEDPLGSAAEELREIRFAHVQRQRSEIVPAERKAIEGVKLRLVVVLAGVKALKSEMPSTPSTTASPSMTNCVFRIFRAVSTIHGYRPAQSCPPLLNSRTRLPWRSTRSR
jgi:hypothetical protein